MMDNMQESLDKIYDLIKGYIKKHGNPIFSFTKFYAEAEIINSGFRDLRYIDFRLLYSINFEMLETNVFEAKFFDGLLYNLLEKQKELIDPSKMELIIGGVIPASISIGKKFKGYDTSYIVYKLLFKGIEESLYIDCIEGRIKNSIEEYNKFVLNKVKEYIDNEDIIK